MKIRCFISLIALLFSYNLAAQSYTVSSVPSPKSAHSDAFVANPNNIISGATEQQINALATQLESENGSELAVVLLHSVGDIHIKEFATALFEEWGIGKKGADNGLLILFVEDQRSVTFETGYGIEGDLTDALSKRIQIQQMLPHFKEGDYDTGMLNGVVAVVEVLQRGEYVYDELSHQTFKQKHPFWDFTLKAWAIVFILASIIIIVRLNRVVKDKKHKKVTLHKSYTQLKGLSNGIITAAIFSPLLILPFFFLNSFKNRTRRQSRPCKKCGRMIDKRLDEKTDDLYLVPSRVKEEQLGSIDYDVWLCDYCDNREIIPYARRSRYKACPHCKTVASHQISNHVIQGATTLHSGSGEFGFRCEFCGKQWKKLYIIPIIVASSGGGGSFGGGSSGGGSFGGGSSGGGGATSSW